MSEASKYNLSNAQFAGGFAETVQGDQIGGNIHNYAQQQNLVEAAAEIRQLLQQLDQDYATNTPQGQEAAAQEAIRRIEKNLPLKARMIGALKAAGVEAFKEAVDQPLINVVLAGWEGWQEPK
jgi:hypothetical protein